MPTRHKNVKNTPKYGLFSLIVCKKPGAFAPRHSLDFLELPVLTFTPNPAPDITSGALALIVTTV